MHLGCEFSGVAGLAGAPKHRCAKGLKKVYALQNRCASLGVFATQAQLRLLNSIVLPTCLYGAETWGPLVLPQHKGSSPLGSVMMRPIEQPQLVFLREALHVDRSTMNIALYLELG